jgi:hypothetical protein
MPCGSVAGGADHNAGTIFRHWSIAASYERRESGQERRVGRGTLVSPMGPRCIPSVIAPAPLSEPPRRADRQACCVHVLLTPRAARSRAMIVQTLTEQG